MAGYSYFDYDQMTLLGIEVHSNELELLNRLVHQRKIQMLLCSSNRDVPVGRQRRSCGLCCVEWQAI